MEHFIFLEIKAYLSYSHDSRTLAFWRTRTGNEVDFIIGDETAIEIKSSEYVNERHAKGLVSLSEERHFKNLIIVSMDPEPRMMNNIRIVPVIGFLKMLWNGEL
ncbi:MAG: DUF4143 domain-containing protein [Spirochaetales bacterium]|nr:DUF4143 domain-containing protein [Spirochaetales bacterium]